MEGIAAPPARPDLGQRFRTLLFTALVGLGCAGLGAALILLAYRPDELTRHLAASSAVIAFALAGRVASGPRPLERRLR